MIERFDAVIVGIGFGGTIAACRLAQKGMSVLALERGRRWGREDLPDERLTRRFLLMKEGADKLGCAERFRKLPLAVNFGKNWRYDSSDPFNEKRSETFANEWGIEQGTCVHCGNCDIGCPVGARNALDLNYIPQL